jgi:hypothetical protein
MIRFGGIGTAARSPRHGRSVVSGCAHDGAGSRQAATAPREQPGLDDELDAAGSRVDREHAQPRMGDDSRRDEEGDTADNRHPIGKQQWPLVAELRPAAEDDDKLHRTADGGPDAEDREDRRDASGRGHTERDGGGDAEPGVDQQ